VTTHWAVAESDGDCLPDWEPAPRVVEDLPDISEWNNMTDQHITAPFTPEQVEALNRWQEHGPGHPFTCPRSRHAVHVALIARTDSWHCSDPACDYRQDWAHPLMVGTAPPADKTAGQRAVRKLMRAERNAVIRAETAEAAIARVRELHVSSDKRRPLDLCITPIAHCAHCGSDWPCPTVQTLDAPTEPVSNASYPSVEGEL